MDVIKTIAPGQKGSIRYLKEWGEKLVNARYRKSAETNEIVTTIEVVMDRRQKVKQTGARWSKQLSLWIMKRKTAVQLGLVDRVVEGAAEECSDVDSSFH